MRRSVQVLAMSVMLAACGTVILADHGEREDDDRHEGRRAARHGAATPAAATQPVSYTRDVKPLLEDRCYVCHSGPRAKGGVKLDTRAGLSSQIRTGDGAGSSLVRAMNSGEMPPRGDKVPPDTIGLVRGWIDQGAKWDQ